MLKNTIIDKEEINKNFICYLKNSPNSGDLTVDYLPILKPLEQEFEKLIPVLQKEDVSRLIALEIISNNSKLKVLLNRFNYCKNLTGTYQEILSDYKNLKEEIKAQFLEYEKETNISQEGFRKQQFLKGLKNRLNAFHIEEAYKACEEKREKDEILAFSHRKVGWSNPKYDLSKNFSFEIKTNFGYGSSRYFYSIFNYKGVNIIHYTDWIRYRIANTAEIINYSKEYPLENASWYDALQDAAYAGNLSLKNEEEFIRTYILNEFEGLVVGLKDFLVNNNFSFNNYTFSRLQPNRFNKVKKGFEVTALRGEKISGALDFILSMQKFKHIIGVDEFIKQIEECNKKLLPLLAEEMPRIRREVNIANNKLKKVEPRFLELNKRKTQYDNARKKLENKMMKRQASTKSLDTNELNRIFNLNHPDFGAFEKELISTKREYEEIISKINNLKKTQENIKTYAKKIEQYF